MGSLHNKSQAGPTLLTLPTEIRGILLRYIFCSRTIRFAASRAHTLEETGIFSKIYHEWRLGFLGACRQLYAEGRTALRSIIAESTLVLDGLLPGSDGRRDKLDRSLYTRRMLSSFITQYGNEVRVLRTMATPSSKIDLAHFGGLVQLIFELKVSTAFEVMFPAIGNSNTQLIMQFSDFEQGATDEAVQLAIVRMWKELKALGELEGNGGTIPAVQKMIAETRERKDLQLTVFLHLAAASSLGIDAGSSRQIELVVDGKTDEVLSFTRC